MLVIVIQYKWDFVLLLDSFFFFLFVCGALSWPSAPCPYTLDPVPSPDTPLVGVLLGTPPNSWLFSDGNPPFSAVWWPVKVSPCFLQPPFSQNFFFAPEFAGGCNTLHLLESVKVHPEIAPRLANLSFCLSFFFKNHSFFLFWLESHLNE